MTEGEVWKANAERNARIEAERPLSFSMDIYSKPGDRIVFMGRNGYEYQLQEAKLVLSIGGTYTIKRINVENWSSSVELLELPGKWFNTVMFRDADQ